MLDKLEKLEEKINEVIERLKAFVFIIFNKLIPQKLIDFVVLYRAKSKAKIARFKSKLSSIINVWSSKVITIKDFIMKAIEDIQKYPIKEKSFVLLENVKRILLKTPIKNHAHWFIDKLKHHINKFDAVLEKWGKSQIGFATTVLFVMSIGFYNVYESSNKIYQKENPTRTPASVQEYAKRPEYKKYSKRTLRVQNIKVPIFKENVNQVRSITIDFTVRTSTRFAKQYLVFHESHLKDYFFTSVEPVISSFPLEAEGKLILKEKILYELNNFLIDQRVEGLVEEVNIVFINAN
jgi:hypothetical protein